MQITEFLRLIGGLYYYSYSCITKKWITWIYAEKLHFETFFLQDEPLLLHSKLNQAQHVKSRILPKLKEWMVENIIKGHLRRRNNIQNKPFLMLIQYMRMIFSATQIEYMTLWSDRNTFWTQEIEQNLPTYYASHCIEHVQIRASHYLMCIRSVWQ